MLLSDVLHRYCLEHELCDRSVEQLQIVVRQFARFAGQRDVEEITAKQVNQFVVHLAGVNAARTVHGKLGNLMTLLRAAIDDGLRGPLGRIRNVKVPANCVEGYTPEEVRKLLEAAEKLEGWFPQTGVKRADWWMAFVHAAWDTAFRLGDLLELRTDQLKDRGDVKVAHRIQHKTGFVIVKALRPETWAAIQTILGQGQQPREVVFCWAAKRYQFYVAFKQLAKLAGLKGTSKYLRRSRVTDTWKREGPEAAAKMAGHRDPTGLQVSKHYLDRSQLTDELTLPPAIGPTI